MVAAAAADNKRRMNGRVYPIRGTRDINNGRADGRVVELIRIIIIIYSREVYTRRTRTRMIKRNNIIWANIIWCLAHTSQVNVVVKKKNIHIYYTYNKRLIDVRVHNNKRKRFWGPDKEKKKKRGGPFIIVRSLQIGRNHLETNTSSSFFFLLSLAIAPFLYPAHQHAGICSSASPWPSSLASPLSP